MSIVSASDFNRIRSSVQPPVRTDKETRRADLKKQSTARTDKWPNTLEAMRKKKDNWKLEKEENEERRRLAIDANELHLQKEVRLQQIERANKLLYERTDKMKTLRSKQLLADVVQDRKIQLMEKSMLQQHVKDEDQYWDAVLRNQLADAEIKEKCQEQKLKAKHGKLAMDQQIQLEEYKQRYVKRLQEENLEGEKIKLKAAKDYQEDIEADQRRRLKAQQANEETKLANDHLILLRTKEREKEVLEEEKRKIDARKKEELLSKRTELQRLKEKKMQLKKQRMIDLATEHLSKLEKNTEQRLENQKKEVRKKEDNELRLRAERRQKEEDATRQSREYQLSRKAQLELREREQAQTLIKQWTNHNIAVEMDEASQARERKMDAVEYSHNLKIQAQARSNREMEEKATKFLSEKSSKDAILDEDLKYREIAKSVLMESKAKGIHNTIPLQAAVKAKSIDLIPAGGFRV